MYCWGRLTVSLNFPSLLSPRFSKQRNFFQFSVIFAPFSFFVENCYAIHNDLTIYWIIWLVTLFTIWIARHCFATGTKETVRTLAKTHFRALFPAKMKSPPCLWAHCLDSLCAIMTVPDCATKETHRLGDLGRPFRTPFRICQEPIDLYSCHALKKRSRSPRDNNFFTDYRVIKFKITAYLDSENRNTVLWKKNYRKIAPKITQYRKASRVELR